MKKALIIGTLLQLTFAAHSQPGHLNSSFGQAGITKLNFFPPNTLSEECVKVLQQADGKPLIIFNAPSNSINGSRTVIKRLTTTGANDATYASSGFSQTANISAASAALQPDGKVVIVGSYWNGTSADFALARYNTNGTLDNTFSGDGIQTTDFGSSDGAGAVAIQSDGKIVVAGNTLVGTQSDFAVARYNTNGNLDPTFDGDGKKTTTFSVNSDNASSIAIQSDGKIVVGGSCMNINSLNSDFALVRYQPNGALDPSFDGDGRLLTNFGFDDRAFAMTLQADGKIILAGESWNEDEYNSDFALARYNSNGSLDASFSGDGKQLTNFPGVIWVGLRSVTVDGTGKILACGTGWDGNTENFTIVRYLSNGNSDPSFADEGLAMIDFDGGYDHANSIQLQSNGRILLGGTSYLEDNSDFAVARLNANGTPDLSFNLTGQLLGYYPIVPLSGFAATAIQTDGKIVAVGSAFNGVNEDFGIARYNTDGTLDESFGYHGLSTIDFQNKDFATAVAIQKDGKIVVAGYSESGATQIKFATARLTSSGGRDISFNNSLNLLTDFPSHTAKAQAVAIQKDGKIVVAGSAMVGASLDFAAVRYRSDGTLDPTFSSDGMVTTDLGNSEIGTCIAIQPDSKIIIGGTSENALQGNSAFALVRYNTNGSLDGSFSNDGKQTTMFGPLWTYHIITSLALQSDGKIVVGGSASRGINEDFAVARYNSNGNLDPFFSLDGWTTTDILGHTNQRAQSIAIQCDGRIIAGGYTTKSTSSYALARYTSAGATDLTFNTSGIQTIDGTLGSSKVFGLGIYKQNVYAVGESQETNLKAASIASYQLGTNATTCVIVNPLEANTRGTAHEIQRPDLILSVQAMPNPSTDLFSIKINGNSKGSVRIRVIDGLGKIVESRTLIAPNTTISIGNNYSPGIYILEAVQGNNKQTIKLIKTKN